MCGIKHTWKGSAPVSIVTPVHLKAIDIDTDIIRVILTKLVDHLPVQRPLKCIDIKAILKQAFVFFNTETNDDFMDLFYDEDIKCLDIFS